MSARMVTTGPARRGEGGYRWVSCSRDLSWDMSRYRHLVRRGGLDTLCGGSATTPDIWRASRGKPECAVCVAAARRARIEVPS